MESLAMERIVTVLVRALVLFTAFPVHESAHGLAAYLMGDDTAKKKGRISLNPAKHITLFGALFMLFTGFGAATPVPIDCNKFKKRKLGMAVSNLAGPLSNLVLAYLSVIMYRIMAYVFIVSDASGIAVEIIMYIFAYGAMLNIGLAVFNLIPIPPLDGSRIVTIFLPEDKYFGIMKYEKYIFVVFFVIVMSGILDVPLAYMNQNALNVMMSLTDWVDRILFY